MSLHAPFPYFGGKRTIAPQIWAALGNVSHYVEPFFGSGAVLLQRPDTPTVETVNDVDGLLANFWRAVQASPEAVADIDDWPCNEADLHARHLWLVGQRDNLTARLMAEPDWYDVKAAGWWVWGACNWIGGGWCSGEGPWIALDGEFTDSRQLPHMSAGRGVNRKLPHMSAGRGVNRKLPHMSAGQGVNRKQTGDRRAFIGEWFNALAQRLRGVRVACGDWSRVCGPSVLQAGGGVAGVFFDPPYSHRERTQVYACDNDVAADVLTWCADNGGNTALRIVLAGYDGEHNALEAQGWRSQPWKAAGGYGSQGEGRGRDNAARERLWLSPHCIGVTPDLFSTHLNTMTEGWLAAQ